MFVKVIHIINKGDKKKPDWRTDTITVIECDEFKQEFHSGKEMIELKLFRKQELITSFAFTDGERDKPGERINIYIENEKGDTVSRI